MSIGHGGYADLQQLDDTMIIYLYCCYNVNDEDYERFMAIEDGELYIDRDALVEPEIHVKLKRTPSGRKKLISKRVIRYVPFDELLKTGKIKVKNASGTWTTRESGVDIMALRILHKIFTEYQETGILSEHISIFS